MSVTTNFAHTIREFYEGALKTASEHRNESIVDPSKMFVRKSFFTLEETMNLTVFMGAGTLSQEIPYFYGQQNDTPTTSAYVQQRQKVKPEAFMLALKAFNHSFYTSVDSSDELTFYAVDGSDVAISRDLSDKETLISCRNGKCNLLHINAIYDCTHKMYIDAVIQGKHKSQERQAFTTMIDRFEGGENSLITADRGYESYDVFAHLIEKNLKFVVRIKDINSNGILSAYDLPDTEFDDKIETILTKKHTQETKSNPEKYTILAPKTTMSYLTKESPFYSIKFRIVRFRLDDGKYYCVATNLDENKYDIDAVKAIYNKRWGIETSFRELKHTVGVRNFHSKDKMCVMQEIYARMMAYNVASAFKFYTELNRSENKTTKHKYRVNFSVIFSFVLQFMTNKVVIESPEHLMKMLTRNMTPVRSGRSFSRDKHYSSAPIFNYRFA